MLRQRGIVAGDACSLGLAEALVVFAGQRFGVVHLIDVLRGRMNDRMLRWEHQRLSVFGAGPELNDAQWRGVFRQLVAMGYAAVDHSAFGALRLTAAARPLLAGGRALAPRLRQTLDLVAVPLLAGLILVQTVGDEHRLAIDARLPALAVAAVLVVRRAPFLVVVLAAAGTAALLRAVT